MLEFIEICNAGTVTENLANWRLRGGADFDFTAAHSIAPNGLLVVVAFDPLTQPVETAAFRAEYGIDASVPLVGPFTDGPLGDDTGTVRLQRPDIVLTYIDPTDRAALPDGCLGQWIFCEKGFNGRPVRGIEQKERANHRLAIVAQQGTGHEHSQTVFLWR